VIERGLDHGPADALEVFEHLVGRHLADEEEEARRAWLQRLVRLPLHVLVVDADVSERSAQRARARPDGGAGERHKEEPADQHAPERSADRSRRGRVHELAQLHATLLVARHDHRVADVDQILALHRKHFVAHLFGLLLAVECNENQIAHVYPPEYARRGGLIAVESSRPPSLRPSLPTFGGEGGSQFASCAAR
jgi:hypothetical protein